MCRKRRARAVNEVEQETVQVSAEESSIDSVNIKSIHFNKSCSVITGNVKTLASKISVIVPYKVDTCSDGNIMVLYISKKLSPRTTKEQLAVTKKKIYN